ncbi:hypothetical protein ABEB36_002870 [Hypothenemus hampei]|uniref:C3H1-type domain-containing protein n=1 Tax=Hypothenemus hampei TaxID=57062 RepID=A0ABD1F7B1_HYPHA
MKTRSRMFRSHVCTTNVCTETEIHIYMYIDLLLDTLPVCQDFNRGLCSRPTCKFVHLQEGEGVEVIDNRVAVCRDAAKGQCCRLACKYYHIPIELPPAPVMAALSSYLQ